MKKLLVLTGALLVMSASIASAQINLAWRNCIAITSGGASAQANVTYACDGGLNGIPFKGVLSFIAPANMAHFVGADCLLDVQTADPTLPDFWQLGLGECRDGNFSYPASLTGIGNTGSCRNPFAGGGTGGGFQYDVQPGGVRARVQLAFARADEFPLVAGAQYIAGMFTLDTFKDIDLGDGECAGCSVPACLVLNQVNALQTAGQTPPSQDQNVMTAAATRQYITWQGGAVGGSGCPSATPARNKTWGSVKSLYR